MFLAQELDAADHGQPYVSAERPRICMPDLRSRVYGYLATAPVAAPGFRTDGVWVWPESLAEQVRLRGAAPQEQLYAHLRERWFLLPDSVPAQARDTAARAITGEVTPDPTRPAQRRYLVADPGSDAAPTPLLRLSGEPDRPMVEERYTPSGWVPSHHLRRYPPAPGPQPGDLRPGTEYVEVSDREAAALMDTFCAQEHAQQLADARESVATPGGLRLARVFDGMSPAGEPWFSPCRLRIPEATRRERLATYLATGRLVVRASGSMVDPLDERGGARVPLSYRTDGRWVWQEALAYYVRTRGVSPELELLCHIEGRGYQPVPQVPVEVASAAVDIIRAGPAPAPLRAPMVYFHDASQALLRARHGAEIDAEVLRADLRWSPTADRWEHQSHRADGGRHADQDFGFHDHDRRDQVQLDRGYTEISEAEAIREIDARWARGIVCAPLG